LQEYGTQVAINLIQGKSLGDALTQVDGTEIVKAAVTDAVTLGVGGLFKGAKTANRISNALDNASDVKKAGSNVKKFDSGKKVVSTDTGKLHAPGDLPDDTNVVRGGTNTVERFENGSGVIKGKDGKLDGVSVNSQEGASIDELSKTIPHPKIGVTTVGDVRKSGGNVVPSPTKNNPQHATMSGLTAEDASKLMKVIPNPSKQ
jgi:hypothetical protein